MICSLIIILEPLLKPSGTHRIVEQWTKGDRWRGEVMSWRSVGKAECGEVSELNARHTRLGAAAKVCLLRLLASVHGCQGTRVQGYRDTWAWARTRKQLSGKLTANPRPAPLICCARQDQPSFKHWLPCAGLRWS
jgi:hypothetical protein